MDSALYGSVNLKLCKFSFELIFYIPVEEFQVFYRIFKPVWRPSAN